MEEKNAFNSDTTARRLEIIGDGFPGIYEDTRIRPFMPYLVDIMATMERMHIRDSQTYDEMHEIMNRAKNELGEDQTEEFFALFEFAMFHGGTIDLMAKGVNLMWVDKNISVRDAVEKSNNAVDPDADEMYDDETIDKIRVVENKKMALHDAFIEENKNAGGSRGALFAPTATTQFGGPGGYYWLFSTALRTRQHGAMATGIKLAFRKMGYTIQHQINSIIEKIIESFSR